MRTILNNSIPITITFNAGMPADQSSYDADPQTGLALRILYSALVRSDSLPFAKFWRDLYPLDGAALTVSTAIECCQLAFGQLVPTRVGILLVVDETAKLARDCSPRSANLVLNALGFLLDSLSSSKFNAVCSTLDALLLNAHRTASGRAITYVPLPELTQGAAEAQFQTALAVHLRSAALPPSIRIAISDCAGHLRTLERLQLATQAASPEFKLEGLRSRTASEMIADDTPQWAVVAALRGDEILLTDTLPGSGGVVFCDAISLGTFINTSAFGSSAVVPKLSMMYLLRFASAQGALSPLVSSIRGMAAAEEASSNLHLPSLGGKPFEQFVAHLLRLQSVLETDSNRSLLQLLHVSRDDLADARMPLSLCSLLRRPFSTDVVGHRVAQWNTTFEDVARRKDCSALDSAGVFSFSNNNPAFDVLYLSGLSSDDDRFAVAIEARITTPRGGSGTSGGAAGPSVAGEYEDTIAEVDRKIELLRYTCRQGGAFAELGVRPVNVLFVYLAARAIIGYDAASRRVFLSRGAVVFDRAATEVFLTPTLNGCLLFRECM